ncbi:ATP-binding protein [Hyphomicrobium sp. LHD-15]|uniref:ATP-binding protein n=1 Tax=Hyphomicrobium sp. LHD-15 TaxID=3072142 RepID=UPI00280CBC5B|nr:ATP-binding protein [Hyphomicrobium sp. LHD-15]MDQ8697493.1 ATP-binding protein [Hyphomicrobium sp. LHD-15]
MALLLLGTLATAVLAVRSRQAEDWVRHTLNVRSDARTVLQDIQSAVLKERAFLLTQDKAKLGDDFNRVLEQITSKVSALGVSVADNPSQVARLRGVEGNIVSLSATLNETVALTETGRHEDAIAIVRSDKVQRLLDELKAQLNDVVSVEDGLLVARERDAAFLQTSSLWVIGGALAIALALSIILQRATRHFVENLQRRTSELEQEIQRRETSETAMRQMQKMEAVGQLSGGIAHDFNNLLTIILGNLEIMKRKRSSSSGSDVGGNLEKHIDMAQQAGRNAAKLTHRLLAFARRQPLEPTRVDCNKLVTDMSDILRRAMSETVDFEAVLGAGAWPAFVDSNQLESALLNLAINAQHAMPNGGKLTIETANTHLDQAYASRFGDVNQGQYVLISVADTGTGIPPDVLEKVFEPFFTTKPSGQGTGLGLSMVHGFVKQSGGHVRIYSEVGHGTTVKLYLPRFDATRLVASHPAGSPDAALPLVRAECDQTVLVVEDNDGVRAYAHSILTDLGYTVREATNADDALAIVESDAHIDLLFTDVILPGGKSGRQLSEAVAKLRPDLPVLFTTGYTPNAIVHHGRLDAGVNFIGKPYTQQELAGRISRILNIKAPK